MTSAYESVFAHLLQSGDGLIPAGTWQFQLDGLQFVVDNANNHQVSWGVLASAVWGVREFMLSMGIAGVVAFSVYDGVNLVGQGRVGQMRTRRSGRGRRGKGVVGAVEGEMW